MIALNLTIRRKWFDLIRTIAKALKTACDTTIELTFTGTDNCGVNNITYSVSGATTISE